MIIKDFVPFIGEHCETTATGSLLQHIGINLSEPMLFCLGEGLGYIFWNMKTMDFPFIGGRVKPDELTRNICKNLNLNLEVKETSSLKKAWSNVKTCIESGIPVGLKLDCYHLDYFTNKIHFAGHYATIYGYDDKQAYLNDTNQQGRDARTSLENLALARSEKGSMSSKNLSYTITKNKDIPQLEDILLKVIRKNAGTFLNPPIKNIGYKGIQKTSKELYKWFKNSSNIESEFKTSSMLMERAGTGGSLFRNIYRDFLKESAELLNSSTLFEASNDYGQIAILWKEISDLFNKIAETKDIDYVNKSSELLLEIAEKEKTTMEKLL